MRPVRVMLAAAAALAVMGVAAVSSQAWDPDGNYTVGSGTETLRSTIGGPGGPTLTCEVVLDADLEAGTWNRGEVNDATITDCTSSTQPCTVSVAENATPWEIGGQNTGGGSGLVSVDHVSYTATYTGGSCPIAGTLTAEGSVAGSYNSGTGAVTFGTGLDTLEVTASTIALVPVGTDVDLSQTVTVQGATKPDLE